MFFIDLKKHFLFITKNGFLFIVKCFCLNTFIFLAHINPCVSFYNTQKQNLSSTLFVISTNFSTKFSSNFIFGSNLLRWVHIWSGCCVKLGSNQQQNDYQLRRVEFTFKAVRFNGTIIFILISYFYCSYKLKAYYELLQLDPVRFFQIGPNSYHWMDTITDASLRGCWSSSSNWR